VQKPLQGPFQASGIGQRRISCEWSCNLYAWKDFGRELKLRPICGGRIGRDRLTVRHMRGVCMSVSIQISRCIREEMCWPSQGQGIEDFPCRNTSLKYRCPNCRLAHPGMIKVDFSPSDISCTPWSQPAPRQRRTAAGLGRHTWNDPANADLNLESSSTN
jgi:hypothetical protein